MSPLQVLHIDSEEQYQERVQLYCLNPFFFQPEVTHINDGKTALKYLKERLRKFCAPDIIITDLSHPEMAAFEFINLIRTYEWGYQAPRRIPIIGLCKMADKFSDLIKYGEIDALLDKSAGMNEIVDAVERVLYEGKKLPL